MPELDVALIEHMEEKEKRAERTVKRARLERKNGALRIKLDEKSVYTLAETMLPIEDIAVILGTSKETLYKRFSEVIAKARGERKQSLSKAMWTKALHQGDSRMMVWLSKQHLGYKESWPDNMQPVSININVSDMP